MTKKQALVNWFKRIRGFGFIESGYDSVDTFVHYVEPIERPAAEPTNKAKNRKEQRS